MSEGMRGRLIDACFGLIGEDGWRAAEVATVCARAGTSERVFRREFATLHGAVAAGLRRLSDAVYAAAEDLEPEDSVRDRLLELILARLDAAKPYKAAMEELRRSAPFDPLLSAVLAQSLDQAMDVILTQAGVEAAGPIGRTRRAALASTVYLPVFSHWLDDDSPDMGPTLRLLDRRLERLEQVARRLPGGQARRRRLRPALGDGIYGEAAPEGPAAPSSQAASASDNSEDKRSK